MLMPITYVKLFHSGGVVLVVRRNCSDKIKGHPSYEPQGRHLLAKGVDPVHGRFVKAAFDDSSSREIPKRA